MSRDEELRIRCQCDLHDVCRSLFYYHSKAGPEENLQLMREIDEMIKFIIRDSNVPVMEAGLMTTSEVAIASTLLTATDGKNCV